MNSVVLIRNGRIENVGTEGSLAVPAGYTRISTEGLTVLPGLWDMHTHLQYSAHADLGHWNATYQPQSAARYAPRLADRYMKRRTFASQVTNVPANGRPDNLYDHVIDDGGERGRNWRGHTRRSSLYTKAVLNPRAAAGIAGAMLAAGALILAAVPRWIDTLLLPHTPRTP